MIKRVTLSNSTIEILNMYGGASFVANKLLDLIEKDELSVESINVPTETSTNCSKITVHITNEWFNNLSKTRSIVSLKRLLQSFVDAELFNEYDFKQTDCNEKSNECASNLLLARSNIINAMQHTLDNNIHSNLQSALLLVNDALEKCV